MNNVASKAAKDDYAPGFFLKHFIKDMGIADEEALAADTVWEFWRMCWE